MLALERQNQIMELIKKQKSVTVKDLSTRFFTCESTIRRDLTILEKKRLIRRTYGGALLLEGLNTEIPFDIREREQADAKNIIGELAAKFVNDGDTVILDSSSTTYAMLKFLTGKENLAIITNGLKTAMTAGTLLNCSVNCSGGTLRKNSSSLVGYGAETFIKDHTVQKLFFSCRALSKNGEAMDVSGEEANLRRTMIERAEEIYLLCDSSKFNKTALNKICDVKMVTKVFTNKKPNDELISLFQENGTEIIYSL